MNLYLFQNSNFQHEKCSRIVSNGKVIYDFTDLNFIDGLALRIIMRRINYIVFENKILHLPIVLNFDALKFSDKLIYICLECYLNYLIKNTNIDVSLSYKEFKQTITTEGFKFSPLKSLSNGFENQIKFIKLFDLDIEKKHYRRLIHNSNDMIGIVLSDVTSFLVNLNIDRNYAESLSYVIVELVGNAVEHSKSDCLLDLDITDEYVKVENKKVQPGHYYGINVAIINFSKKYIYSDLKEKVTSKCFNGSKYAQLYQAYENHIHFFNEAYNEEMFFTIAAFQNKISGRLEGNKAGGTGLTKLLDGLEESSDMHNCYMITDNIVLYFKPDYLSQNDEEWVGFNKSNDFLNEPPNIINFRSSKIHLPGVGYNLNFVMKRGEDDEKQNIFEI